MSLKNKTNTQIVSVHWPSVLPNPMFNVPTALYGGLFYVVTSLSQCPVSSEGDLRSNMRILQTITVDINDHQMDVFAYVHMSSTEYPTSV